MTADRNPVLSMSGNRPDSGDNSDTVPPNTPGSAENICRHCAGTGKVDGNPCPDCNGSGIVITPVGGAG